MTYTRFEMTELSVCVVCIHLLANGEYNDGEDTAMVTAGAMRYIWGQDLIHISPGGEWGDENGFCTSSCDGCGDEHHGDRFAATLLTAEDWKAR